MQIEPVAKIYTPFTGKFGIPRQSGLVQTAATVELEPPYRSPEAVRGIEGFSHLWLLWEFTEAKRETGALTVRPPRLGGNERVGVFASRSPYRPNGLGLSCVKLLRVDYDAPRAPVLHVSGADLLNGTPIYDIKPYLPFTDCVPDAVGGFAAAHAGEGLRVALTVPAADVPGDILAEIKALIAEDPRPHYQSDPMRVYAFEYAGWHVEFTCEDGRAALTALTRGEGS